MASSRGGVHRFGPPIYRVILEDAPTQVLRRRQPRPRRWILHDLMEDVFEAAILAGSWPAEEERARDPGICADSLRDLVIK